MEDMQPGQVIIPHSSGSPTPPGDGAPEPVRPPDVPEPAPAPGAVPEPITPLSPVPVAMPSIPAAPAAVAQPAPAAFNPEQPAQSAWQAGPATNDTPLRQPIDDEIQWTASEFIAHDKSPAWYALLALAGLVAAGLDYLITKDKFSTGIILFSALAFGLFAARKPRTQQYTMNAYGVLIGNRAYNFEDFKTFSIAEEGAIASIIFMPLKRFMPPLTIYVAPETEDRVVDFLADFLPMDQHKPDAVDSLMRRIHF